MTDEIKPIHQVYKKLIRYRYVITVLASMGLSLFVAVVYVDVTVGPILKYDSSMAITHEIKVKILVNHFNGSVQWIDPDFITIPDIYNDPSNKFTKETYTFSIDTSGLNKTWQQDGILIYYFIDESAYIYFAEIECYWRVEDKEGLLKKSSGGFTFNGSDYIKIANIDSAMNKDNVPDMVQTEITLYSR